MFVPGFKGCNGTGFLLVRTSTSLPQTGKTHCSPPLPARLHNQPHSFPKPGNPRNANKWLQNTSIFTAISLIRMPCRVPATTTCHQQPQSRNSAHLLKVSCTPLEHKEDEDLEIWSQEERPCSIPASHLLPSSAQAPGGCLQQELSSTAMPQKH